MSTRGKRFAQVIAGVVVGLGLAEAAFWVRDDGAFPHVAFYVSDDTLGTRLQPNASQRIAFGGNPTTTISTNSRGYRGADWPATAADKNGSEKNGVLVVGDSQVYGLGVENDATFSSVLAQESGRPVLNGGVPTYGPFEYAAVVDEVLAERGASTSHVVFVVNLANDLFEATRPNKERHKVWDGWAVRSETMPTDFMNFPGRTLLFSKSHAVFALRKLLTTPPQGDDRGFSSEGGWQELVHQAERPPEVIEELDDDPRDRPYGHIKDPTARARVKAADDLRKLESHVDVEASRRLLMDVEAATEEEARRIAAHRGSAIDIVVSEYAEAGREVAQTASILLAAAQVRKKNDDKLREIATKKNDINLQHSLDDKDKARAALDDVAHPIVDDQGPPPSPLRETLERVKAACDRVGATLVVVALPLDVMVSPAEWAKYGVPEGERADMSAVSSTRR